jgi:hypothetical protein
VRRPDLEAVMVADRAALGPDRTELLRAPVPGEFLYDAPPGVLVLVTWLGPGLRTRQLVRLEQEAA